MLIPVRLGPTKALLKWGKVTAQIHEAKKSINERGTEIDTEKSAHISKNRALHPGFVSLKTLKPKNLGSVFFQRKFFFFSKFWVLQTLTTPTNVFRRAHTRMHACTHFHTCIFRHTCGSKHRHVYSRTHALIRFTCIYIYTHTHARKLARTFAHRPTVRLVQKRQNWRNTYFLFKYLIILILYVLIHHVIIYCTWYFGCYGNNLQRDLYSNGQTTVVIF